MASGKLTHGKIACLDDGHHSKEAKRVELGHGAVLASCRAHTRPIAWIMSSIRLPATRPTASDHPA
jgi:hypothetical protein